jgi:HSP20 family molecular chaperone IbpA
MKQQTAVEWLIKEFNLEEFKATIEFAKAKEKEQIEEAYDEGIMSVDFESEFGNARLIHPELGVGCTKYYNETYNQIK